MINPVFRVRLLRQLVTSWMVLLMPLVAWSDEEPPAFEFFEQKIRPVLVQHCYECHSASSEQLQGELRLDDRAAIRAGGPSGPTVVPGKPSESLILAALRHEDFEMPPKGKLPQSVVHDFERWIRLGATDPRDGSGTPVTEGIDLEQGRQFWAFRPLRPMPLSLPAATAGQASSPIDRFVEAPYQRVGLTANPVAEPAELIRRLYFDLIGIPPTPSQVSEFASDGSPDAYAQLVDQLLSSVDFGPHWGRHWLDVVRYSDSSGGGRTRIFRDAWRYRDYVIAAFNQDQSYDSFVTEQIAGDLLPFSSNDERERQLTATGFLALGPTNYELQDKELLRMEVVDEQLDTLGRAMLGMTIGCARCHDHKFDPIAASDYYALAGILRSTQTLIHANVSDPIKQELPVESSHRQQLVAHAKAVKQLKHEIDKRQARLKQRNPGSLTSVPINALPGVIIDDTQIESTGSWVKSSHTPRFVGQGYQHDRDQRKGEAQAKFRTDDLGSGTYEVRVSYSAGANRCSHVPVMIKHADGEDVVSVDQTQPPGVDGLFASVGRFRFESVAEVNIRNAQTKGHVIIDAVQFVKLPSREVAETVEQVSEELTLLETELDQLNQQLKQLEENAPPQPDKVMSVRDEKVPEDACICIRGNVHNTGPRVARGFLRVADDVDRWQLSEGESGRRELAAWICDETNPLTARVIANRVWHHLLGNGLVTTPDNFGSTGQKPTHPALLDYLAAELIRHDWSVKHLIREIVTSHTYQLSSKQDSESARLDPQNRLLWRGNRRRLTAEQLRDAILTCSGQLDRRMKGPAVSESATSEFGYAFSGNRRGVYVPVFRNSPLDLFDVFDVADANIVVGRRNVSTRATQALFMMNSPFVIEQASRLAELMLVEATTFEERAEWLHQRVLGRHPTSTELQQTHGFVADLQTDGVTPVDAWAMVTQSLFACLDFRYLH